MWNFTYTCIPNNSLSCVSFFLYVSFQTSLWVMNNSHLLPLPIMAFFFINLSFVGLSYAIHESQAMCQFHMLIHAWETSLHFNVHGNLAPHHDLTPLTTLLGLFSRIVYVGFYGLIWCDIPSLLQLRKGLIPASYVKGLRVHAPPSLLQLRNRP